MLDQAIQGRVYLLGDDVNTDLNCSGKYLPGKDEAFIATQAFEAIAPGFAARFSEGGIIVAGKHFGINSSREQAVHILRRMGVAAIVAPSFGRQFFRNAINNGLPVVECDVSGIEEGDSIEVDMAGQKVCVASRQLTRPLGAVPDAIRAILREGGLIPFLKKIPQLENHSMSAMPTPTQLRTILRARLKAAQQGGTALIAPGVFDGYGARMVQQQGFEAVYMTGNGVSASLLGRPDVGLIDLSLMSGHARRVASCVSLPLICDADTGYGNVVGVRRTIEEFEAAGVAAIHMEDQISPKRCAQLPGDRSVLPFREAVAKIEAAVAARKDDQFMIIARTDSVGAAGLAAGIQRAQAFQKAGADAVFVELKAHDGLLDDLKRIAESLTIPCTVNIDAGGPLLGLPASMLHLHGVALAIYPALLRNAVGFAMREALQHLQNDGHTLAAKHRQLSSKEYNDCLGLPEVEKWEGQFPV